VQKAPQPGVMLAATMANLELARMGSPAVALPADGKAAATGEALRSALAELNARGWRPW